MSDDKQVTPPAVMWAQRSNSIFLTICLEDCKDPKIDIQPDSVYFYGVGGTEKKLHEVKIDLYALINPNTSKVAVMDRTIEFTLKKKVDESFWPRLTKEKNKYHWLKINFAKWKDESDSDSEPEEDDNLENMMRSMGGLENNLAADGEDEPSSEEELPDLE